MYFPQSSSLLLLFVCFFVVCSSDDALEKVTATSAKDYVNLKLKETRDWLLEVYDAAEDNDETVGKWKNVKMSEEASTSKILQPRAINIFDEMFMIDEHERRLFPLVFNLDKASNASRRAAVERQLNLASPNQPINFIKSYFWSGMSFLLVCQMSYCTHYHQAVDGESTLEYRQIIEYPGFMPIDATFFTHDDKVYLVIAYNLDNYSSKMYRWNGTHMDYLVNLDLAAPKSVVTFPDGQSTILLFTLNDGPCIIYRLKENNSIEKMKSSTGDLDTVTSIYPYKHAEQQFFLTTNDAGVAEILRWNGDDFEKLIDLPEIQPQADQIRILQIDHRTLLFFSHSNALSVYQIDKNKVMHLSELALENERRRIIEITPWIYENTIMMLLVTINPDGTFQTELWQMNLRTQQFDERNYAQVRACFGQLKDALDSRAAMIDNFQMTRSLVNHNESNKTFPLHLTHLMINEGNISVVEFRKRDETNVSSPRQIKEKLMQLREELNALKIEAMKNTANLSGRISIDDQAYFQELYVDKLAADYVNGERADFENYLISGIDQQFSTALKLKKTSIEDLSVSSLCGRGFDHWLQVNDSVRSAIVDSRYINSSSIINDTIVIEPHLIMQQINVRSINGRDLNHFLDNIFLLGNRQLIKGDVRFDGIVRATRLYSDKVNNVSSSDLISKPTNQSLRDVFIDTLAVEKLYVQKINGVPIDRAARTSTENLIKGQVTLANLVITDQLRVKDNVAIPLTHSSQVYDEIRIDGNVFLKSLELEEQSSLRVDGRLASARIHSLARSSWSKSSDQAIEAPISLEMGASIDRLDCSWLNGLAEEDFLYTDSAELADLENLTFAHFHFNRVRSENSESPVRFVEESNDRLTFHEAVRMKHLSVNDVRTNKYNGIPIDSIMRPNDLLEFPDEIEFETVLVEDQLIVAELHIDRLNRKSAEAFSKALRIDASATLDQLPNTEQVVFADLSVGKLNGRDLEEALNAQEGVLHSSDAISLTIDSEVTVEASLRVDRINGEEASDYVDHLREVDPSDLMRVESLPDLTILDNLEVGLLNGQTLQEFFAASLSKTQRQTFQSPVTFIDARMNYLTADTINSVDLSQLIYTDRPAASYVIYANASFSHLRVRGNVKTRMFNGENASEILPNVRRIPMTNVENLLVQDDVQWDKSSTDLYSLTRLLDKAVTKHEQQLIDTPITFEQSLIVESLYSYEESSELSRKITEIISDAVIDDIDSNTITVRGTKIFKRGMTVDDLTVDGNIDIERVNGLDIVQFNSQIFRKDRAEIMTAEVTFVDEVEIARLITNSQIHGVSLQKIAVESQRMPKKLHFQHLIVEGNVSVYKLDGVDFDDFVKRRVTLDEDNEIFVDVEFTTTVRVSNASFVATVNGIAPESLVQSDVDGIPVMIHGNKIFRAGLIVEKNLETVLINDFNVDSIYTNAVLNGTEANILGNLIFENGVEMSGNVTVSGAINGLKLQRSGEMEYLQNHSVKNTLDEGISLLNASFDETDKSTSAATLLYLEEEEKFDWHFAGVQSVKSFLEKNQTRLEIIAEDMEDVCDLQADCFCRKQYIVDVFPSGDYEIKEQNVNNVTYTFRPPESIYGLMIVSEYASYSEECSRTSDGSDSSKVFWLKFNGDREILKRTPALHINGYISDAQIFQFDDQLYLIVAIFYNKETESHATDSLLYQFDVISGKVFMVQSIATDGAKSIDIFTIPSVGLHLVIGCVKGRAESLLLRFNPITRQFQMIRTFATAGSKYVASLSSSDKTFVILNNPDVKALQIFNYDDRSNDFLQYQILFFESRVTSLGVFYSGDIRHSDAFVVTTTKDGWLYIYEYMFYGKFQLKMSHWADDVQILTPFRHMNENYLFAGFKFNSTVYKVIQQGY